MTGSGAERPQRGQVWFHASVYVMFLGAYLLFAGQASRSECLTGVVAAALATALAAVWRTAGPRRFRMLAPWPRLVGAPLASLGPDAVRVGACLAAAIRRRPPAELGAIQGQPFRAGGDRPEAAARRGLVALAVSFAPNGYMLDIEGDSLLLHRLRPDDPQPDPVWPL